MQITTDTATHSHNKKIYTVRMKKPDRCSWMIHSTNRSCRPHTAAKGSSEHNLHRFVYFKKHYQLLHTVRTCINYNTHWVEGQATVFGILNLNNAMSRIPSDVRSIIST